MRFIKFYLLGIILGLVVILSSCSKNNDDVELIPVQTDVSLSITMKHMVGSNVLDFDMIQYFNAFGNNYSVITLKYFVSDFRFYKADGGVVFVDETFYVDATDATTMTFIPLSKLPLGDYNSVSFVFGLDSVKNISGAFPNPPENAMEWPAPLGGGYHYMKLEGKVDSSGVINNFQAHTGPTMGNSNFINVTLPASSFQADKEDLHLTLVMDINKWWKNPNTLDLNQITGIMGNQNMQVIMHDNGNDVFNVLSIE